MHVLREAMASRLSRLNRPSDIHRLVLLRIELVNMKFVRRPPHFVLSMKGVALASFWCQLEGRKIND